jgi:hypothetical protein
MAEEPSKSQTWWQTLPGILTAVAATITAITGLIVALYQAGLLSWATKPLLPAPTTTPSIPTSPSPPVGQASSSEVSTLNMNELEQKLRAANIVLSTGNSEDMDRVRGYFVDSKSAYYLLAVNCLQVVGNQRLKKTGYLDMIDKWYTILVGEKKYAPDNENLNLDKLKEAMVKAQNEYHGDTYASFEQIVEPR